MIVLNSIDSNRRSCVKIAYLKSTDFSEDLTNQVNSFFEMNEITADGKKQQGSANAEQFWQKIEATA